jgi:Ca2+-binding EF-hand superfamily protein
MKRVRVNEFFKDFDKLRKGRVTKTQFKSVLSTLSFTLTDEEYQTLIERYSCDDPNMVNYAAFVDSIDSIFTIKGIEKMPTVRVKPIEARDTNLARKKYLEFDDEEKRLMIQVMLAYKDQILVKRLNLKPMFQDFDITRCGHVTKTQFVRILNQLGILTQQ